MVCYFQYYILQPWHTVNMRHSNGNAEASGMGNFKQQKWFGTQLEVTAD